MASVSATLQEGDHSNLFARLSPDLLAALSPVDASKNDEDPSFPDFVALEIQLGAETLYSSFNGGLLPELKETIQLPRALLHEVRDVPGTVQVRALPRICNATQVNVESNSVADWELMQVHAHKLEAGHFLQQVSVVHTNQVLALQIQGEEIRMRVKDISFPSNDPWPSSDSKNDEFAVLTQNTEILVSPRPRESSKTLQLQSRKLRLVHGRDDMHPDMAALADRLKKSAIAVPPGSISISPTIANEIGAVEWVTLHTNNQSNKNIVVRVNISSELDDDFAGLRICFDLIRLSVASAPFCIGPTEVLFRPVQLKRSDMTTGLTPSIPFFSEGEEEITVPLNTMVCLPPSAKSTSRSIKSVRCLLLCSETVEPLESDGIVVRLSASSLHRRAEEISAEEETIGVYAETQDLPRCVFDSSIVPINEILASFEAGDNQVWTLTGPVGSGKTHAVLLAKFIAQIAYGWRVEYVDCRKLCELHNTMSEIVSSIDEVFANTNSDVKSLILLDDLDSIASRVTTTKDGMGLSQTQGNNPILLSQSKLIADHIINNLDSSMSRAFVLSTCESAESINETLCDKEATSEVPCLGANQRFQLFAKTVAGKGNDLEIPSSKISDRNFMSITESFRPRDLVKAASRLVKRLQRREDFCDLGEEALEILRNTTPLSNLDLDQPSSLAATPWSDIGGLFEVRKELERALLFPIRYKAIYSKAKAGLPRGILLFGPTGCGKSCLIPAIASKCSIPLISCKGPEVLDRYIGASEAKVRDLFKRAASVAPSILFLDELDALAPRRGSDHTGVTDRVVNQLLTFLDGVEEGSVSNVFIVGATSRPDKIDPALLRPGRLEKHLFVGLPETDAEQIDLFRRMANNASLSNDCQHLISRDESIMEVISGFQKGGRMSPVDVKAALDTAHLKAVHRLIKSSMELQSTTELQVEYEDLVAAVSETNASTSEDDETRLDEIYCRYRKNKKGPPRAKESRTLLTSLR